MPDSAAPLSLDARGLLCPQPVIELARAIATVAIGDVVEVLADDPAAVHDIPAWCRMSGHDLVSSRQSGPDLQIQVRRSF